MPWTSRPSRKPGARLRQDLRRWRYDHSHDLRAVWIGAGVVGLTLLAIAALRALT